MTSSARHYPNAREHNTDPKYVAELVRHCRTLHGFTSQPEVAKRIGVGVSTLKDWISGKSTIIYSAQYALEELAEVRKYGLD